MDETMLTTRRLLKVLGKKVPHLTGCVTASGVIFTRSSFLPNKKVEKTIAVLLEQWPAGKQKIPLFIKSLFAKSSILSKVVLIVD